LPRGRIAGCNRPRRRNQAESAPETTRHGWRDEHLGAVAYWRFHWCAASHALAVDEQEHVWSQPPLLVPKATFQLWKPHSEIVERRSEGVAGHGNLRLLAGVMTQGGGQEQA
jgi:hypothetical protein